MNLSWWFCGSASGLEAARESMTCGEPCAGGNWAFVFFLRPDPAG
jgi:hypothetical protein